MFPELVDLLLAGSRWLVYLGVFAMVGAAGAQIVARRAARHAASEFTATLKRRLPGLALESSILWVFSLITIFAAQAVSWFGVDGLTDPGKLRSLIAESRWGAAWSNVFVISLLTVTAHAIARRWPRSHASMAGIAAAVAVIATPLIGHAAGQGPRAWFLHAAHLGGAGLWMGTLLLIAWPTWKLWSERSAPGGDLRQMLEAFTPVALGGAALMGTTGVLLTTAQIWPLDTFFDTPYGAALSRKLVVVAAIAGLGWLNWRHFRPGVEIEAKRRHLRRAVQVELTLGLVFVLALTGWLSGLATPAG